ncbi:MAG: type II toxin-antitoxin system HicA family toxin [Myxococcota bacterium]
MPALPRVAGRDCIAALHKAGYRLARQRGSHVRLHHPTRTPVTVPLHKTLDRGTLRAILRTTDIPVEAFIELMAER